MNYYIKEIKYGDDLSRTAGFKARDDVESIFEDMGIKLFPIQSVIEDREKGNAFTKLMAHHKIKANWAKRLSALHDGDTLFVQFPIVDHSLFLYKVFKSLKKRQVKIVLLVHDLEMLRWSKREDVSLKERKRLKFEEYSILDYADHIIVHNEKMKDYMSDLVDVNKLVVLEIFDYLLSDFNVEDNQKKYSKDGAVIIAGNLRKRKAAYAYDLPENYPFHLYGIEYEGKTNDMISYFGSFPPNDLPYAIEGGYGLVWDGESKDTCTGTYGDYLRINNPHKTSFYLSVGLPVVIWSHAALADFVKAHHCGIVVDSLDDIKSVVDQMSEEDYQDILLHTKEMSQKLTNGYYTRKAIQACL
jgi:hypothetical protein